jgi:membrane-bound lytic murein transglycosylase B
VAQSDEFAAWLAVVRAEALTLGIRPQTLDTALNGVRLQPLVIELDRKQPERTITYAQYLARALPKARVQRGHQLLRRYQTLLHEIATRYGVPARFVVALWGIESNFGQTTGDFQSSLPWPPWLTMDDAVPCSVVNYSRPCKLSMKGISIPRK